MDNDANILANVLYAWLQDVKPDDAVSNIIDNQMWIYPGNNANYVVYGDVSMDGCDYNCEIYISDINKTIRFPSSKKIKKYIEKFHGKTS